MARDLPETLSTEVFNHVKRVGIKTYSIGTERYPHIYYLKLRNKKLRLRFESGPFVDMEKDECLVWVYIHEKKNVQKFRLDECFP